jgi:hypothetical protein
MITIMVIEKTWINRRYRALEHDSRTALEEE